MKCPGDDSVRAWALAYVEDLYLEYGGAARVRQCARDALEAAKRYRLLSANRNASWCAQATLVWVAVYFLRQLKAATLAECSSIPPATDRPSSVCSSTATGASEPALPGRTPTS